MQRDLSFITQICKHYGVENAVICPGSRSAPLVSTFVNSTIRCLNIVDERSAAYFALGMAIESLKPVVIISTSGTAALNFAPAMAEAYYQRIPLIAITADRPIESIGQMEGQAINQTEIFRNFSLSNLDINGDLLDAENIETNVKLLQNAFNLAIGKRGGPIHFNIRFSEPLYNNVFKQLNSIELDKIENQQFVSVDKDLVSEIKMLPSNPKVLFLLGMDFKKTISKEILDALYSSNVVVLSEALGNISDSKSIKNFDEVLHKYQDHLKPDLVITFGLGMVSKRIRLYIKSLQNVVHWHIDESGEAIDTYRKLSKVWEIHPNQFLQTFTNKLTANKEYFDLWNQYSETIEKLSSIFDSGSEFSDYKAIKKIIENLPSNAQLHAGNSTPIRYVNLFASKIPSSIKVLSNRGTSGIDGCTSTASGAQYLSSKMNVLILGDLSFHYDINGLWNHYLNPKFRIVMINNEGGNIFRLIDGPKRTGNLEEFFETTYRYDAKFLAAHFGLEYYICTNEVELEQILSDFWKMSDKPKLLEVKTGNKSSEEVFKKYFNYIKQ